MSTQENKVALPFRSETILGVCEALGEDFRFNPLFLRVPLAVSVIYSPKLAIGTYLGLGLVVLLSRFLFPKKVVAIEVPADERPVIADGREVEDQPMEFAKAA